MSIFKDEKPKFDGNNNLEKISDNLDGNIKLDMNGDEKNIKDNHQDTNNNANNTMNYNMNQINKDTTSRGDKFLVSFGAVVLLLSVIGFVFGLILLLIYEPRQDAGFMGDWTPVLFMMLMFVSSFTGFIGLFLMLVGKKSKNRTVILNPQTVNVSGVNSNIEPVENKYFDVKIYLINVGLLCLGLFIVKWLNSFYYQYGVLETIMELPQQFSYPVLFLAFIPTILICFFKNNYFEKMKCSNSMKKIIFVLLFVITFIISCFIINLFIK